MHEEILIQIWDCDYVVTITVIQIQFVKKTAEPSGVPNYL